MEYFNLQTPTNIPIELSYYIASYIKKVNDGGMIDSASLTQMNNGAIH